MTARADTFPRIATTRRPIDFTHTTTTITADPGIPVAIIERSEDGTLTASLPYLAYYATISQDDITEME